MKREIKKAIKLFLVICFLLCFLASCTSNDKVIFSDGIKAPDDVIESAEIELTAALENLDGIFPNYNYVKLRVESLEHVYTYNDIMGQKIKIYEFDIALLTTSPENIPLEESNYITDDNWVYSNTSGRNYFVFRVDGDNLTLLYGTSEFDFKPGDAEFTVQIQNYL